MLQNAFLLAAVIATCPYQTKILVTDERGAPVKGARVEVRAEIGVVSVDPIACGSTDDGGIFVTDELGPHKRPRLRGVHVTVKKGVVSSRVRPPPWGKVEDYPREIPIKLRREPIAQLQAPCSPYLVASPETVLCWDPCYCCYVETQVIRCARPVVEPCFACPPCDVLYEGCSVSPGSLGQPTSGSITWQSTGFSTSLAYASHVVTEPSANPSLTTRANPSPSWSNAEARRHQPLSVDGWRASRPD